MASIFKKKRDRARKGSSWYIAYVDEHGRRRMVKGYPDKAATEATARKLESEADLRRRGVIDHKADSCARHQARPLEDHISDWKADLGDRGNTAKHAALFSGRARRVATLAKVERLSDLTSVRVQAALAALRKEGLSLATCNHHRAAIRAFSRWLWMDGRLRDDVLVGVSGFNAREDRCHDRRTL